MHEHSHPHQAAAPTRRGKRRFSLAQQGIGVRLALAAGLVLVIWAAIVPLLAA